MTSQQYFARIVKLVLKEMSKRIYLLLSVLLLINLSFAKEDQSNDLKKEELTKNDLKDETNDLDEDTMVEEELNEEELKKAIKIEYLNKVDNCKSKAKAPDFVTLKFTSKYNDGDTILST